MLSLGFTLDLEDHRPDPSWPKRYRDVTGRILDFLDERDLHATVFVLGRVARESPDLIKTIADRGHEIAFHSFAHQHLTDATEQGLRTELLDNKNYLEDLSSQRVLGYRAPAFSLTRASSWAVDVIKDAGFTYSSSVLPAKNPIFGFPGAPPRAFKWPNGLLELPAPLNRVGPLTLPYLGGIYLRYLPLWVIQQCIRENASSAFSWVYCHPYDFDHGEPFYRIRGTSLLTSILLWFNRKNSFRKLTQIFDDHNVVAESRTFAQLIDEGQFDDAKLFALR